MWFETQIFQFNVRSEGAHSPLLWGGCKKDAIEEKGWEKKGKTRAKTKGSRAQEETEKKKHIN